MLCFKKVKNYALDIGHVVLSVISLAGLSLNVSFDQF